MEGVPNGFHVVHDLIRAMDMQQVPVFKGKNDNQPKANLLEIANISNRFVCTNK